MNELSRAFLDAMLVSNPVVMTAVGALLAVVMPRSAKTSYVPALRFGLTLFLSGLIGGALATAVPGPIAPAIFVVVALTATGSLVALGELRDEWLGLPQAILAIAPVIGVQILVAGHGDLSLIVGASAGNAVGFSAMYVLIAAIRESSRMSETTDAFKTYPVVLYSLAVFAVIMTGFVFS